MDMLSKNFRFLYRYYEDKQEVLARMLHVPQSNISAYVNGKKPIPTDVLNDIATRYNVSADDLMTKDLSLEYEASSIVNLDDAICFSNTFFPFFTSNIAKTNESFNQAYDKVFAFLRLEKLDLIYNEIGNLEEAIVLFQKAWEETNAYVALSNSISTILLMFASYNQRAIKIGQELLDKGSLNMHDVERSLLRDPRKPETGNPYEKQQKAFFEKYDEIVYDNIKFLKSNLHFSELGDFYLAMCNFIGFADEFIEYEVCSQAGMYSFFQLYKLENKYAEKFLESLSLLS